MDITLASKVEHIEEQLRVAISEYPTRRALDRISFALSLAHFVSTQMRMDKDATIPGITLPTIAGIDQLV